MRAWCLVLHIAGGLASDLFHLKNFLLQRKLGFSLGLYIPNTVSTYSLNIHHKEYVSGLSILYNIRSAKV